MKKLLMALALGTACLLGQGQEVLAAPQVATVRGTAKGDNLEEAIRDARHDAVFKSLSHMIDTRNNLPQSVRDQLMRNYDKYVLGIQFVQKKKSSAGSFVIAKVTVDTDSLQRDLEDAIYGSFRHVIHDMPASFLVRVLHAGSPNEADGNLLTTLSSHYSNLGFETETNDQFAVARRSTIHAMDTNSYEGFCSWAEQKLFNEWTEYGFSIIGEVDLQTAQQDASGITRRAVVRVKALDVRKRQYIGTFENSYDYRCADAAEAERQVLNKAAMDFAEKLGTQTMQYWAGR